MARKDLNKGVDFLNMRLKPDQRIEKGIEKLNKPDVRLKFEDRRRIGYHIKGKIALYTDDAEARRRRMQIREQRAEQEMEDLDHVKGRDIQELVDEYSGDVLTGLRLEKKKQKDEEE